MDFDKHIFISYAHIDNQPLTPEQQGWISRFHASFDALLSMRLGRKARIWRDDKLKGNDVFADEITAQFDKTALMISILTPRYVKSEWCTREVREFCERAERHGGIVVGSKSRVLKVLKTPVDSLASLPPLLGNVLGYEFFSCDGDVAGVGPDLWREVRSGLPPQGCDAGHGRRAAAGDLTEGGGAQPQPQAEAQRRRLSRRVQPGPTRRARSCKPTETLRPPSCGATAAAG
jgi:hypothetical protein